MASAVSPIFRLDWNLHLHFIVKHTSMVRWWISIWCYLLSVCNWSTKIICY